MGFFLETLIGGLMAGMLYALVALGFVLIFKASGVFNFAQGAMVLFAALAMARLAEWIPQWTGIEQGAGQRAGLHRAALLMFLVAWLIERLVLRHLVNQPAITLLMATLGIAYLLEGLGQTVFGSDIYKIDVGMPKDPIFVLGSLFDGGVLVDPRIWWPRASRRRWWRCWRCSSRRPPPAARCARWPTTTRPRSRSAFRCAHLGHRLVRGRRGGAGGGHDLGQQAGRAVLAPTVALRRCRW
jgi:hypothetical protein